MLIQSCPRRFISDFCFLVVSFSFWGCKQAQSSDLSSVVKLTESSLHPLESEFPEEGKYIQEAIQIATKGVDKTKTTLEKSGRDAHTKAHGCVQAKFETLEKIPESLRVGVFAQKQSFASWIRYSTASGEKNSDKKSGSLGMAIKLMNVPGQKVLENERNELTQDFLVVNFPTFIVPNIKEYVALQRNPVLYFANPWHLKTLGIIGKIKGFKPADPLESRYWSMSAYSLGNTAVKYSAIPCEAPQSVYPKDPSDDYLAENMQKHLDTRGACFTFAVQKFVDQDTTPVENPMDEWKEEKSEFIPVAKIDIPPQQFRSARQQDFCENLSFTPWHALPEHRPLGNLNRARRFVYEATSKKRHSDNGIGRKEPVSFSIE